MDELSMKLLDLQAEYHGTGIASFEFDERGTIHRSKDEIAAEYSKVLSAFVVAAQPS